MISESICIFSLNSGKIFGEKVAQHLNLSLSNHEEREFEDGEHKIRSLESVRGKDVYVIQSLYSDEKLTVNDKLCRILFFIGSLKESCAKKVTVVIPYLCYARKDRKTKSRDPVTTKYIAKLFESVGTDHIVTMDVHNLQAYQNAFRCYTDHLESKKLFAEYFSKIVANEEVVIMSPDAGGMKRADVFRTTLSKILKREVPLIFMEKKRSEGKVSGANVVGDVKGKTIIVFDDLISSGTTLVRSATTCMEAGSKRVMAAATHGIFNSFANKNLLNSALEKIVITNTISDPQINSSFLHDNKVSVIDASLLIAECIERLHFNESIVDLVED